MANNAKLPMVTEYLSAGLLVNEKNGKVVGSVRTSSIPSVQYMEDLLSEIDRQDFINRGTWYNLPDGISSELLERMLYYNGQLMLFYLPETEKFYILPYTLDGDINIYGRYENVRPVQFRGTNTDTKKVVIPGVKRRVIYDLADWTPESYENDCLILSDRSYALSESCVPRYNLNKGIIKLMAEAIPMARTSLIAHSGIKGVKVSCQDEATNVARSCDSIERSALSGKPWVPITGTTEFQELTDSGIMKTEEYLEYFQALDNLRMKTLGIESGGIFEKKSHMLQDEMALNNTKSSRILDDSVKRRQDFCYMANLIFGLSIMYIPAEQSETLSTNQMINDTNQNAVEESNESNMEVYENE